MPVADLRVGLKNVPHYDIAEDTLVNVLVTSGICTSKREANEFIRNGAISVNGDVVRDSQLMIDRSIALDGEIVIIKRGKKKYYFCTIQ